MDVALYGVSPQDFCGVSRCAHAHLGSRRPVLSGYSPSPFLLPWSSSAVRENEYGETADTKGVCDPYLPSSSVLGAVFTLAPLCMAARCALDMLGPGTPLIGLAAAPGDPVARSFCWRRPAIDGLS